MKVTFLKQRCNSIRPIGSPANIFYRYFSQTMKVFNPNDSSVEIKLIYHKQSFAPANNNRFVFKLKNNFASRWEYVGVITTIREDPNDSKIKDHVILRYI